MGKPRAILILADNSRRCPVRRLLAFVNNVTLLGDNLALLDTVHQYQGQE
jgi:hypothetical protein